MRNAKGIEQKVTKETKGARREAVAVRGREVPGGALWRCGRLGQPTLPGERGGAVGFGEFAPLAGAEVVWERELADGYPEEAEGWVADGGGHFADLAVAAFAEGEFEPARRDVLAGADGGIARGDE